MTVITLHPLVDGPISLNAARIERAGKVARMADFLIKSDTFRDERDSIRSLVGHFPMFEIVALLDDARQVAMQHVVAMEMSDG